MPRIRSLNLLTLRNLTIAICFLSLAATAPAQTADVDKNWTTVGSAGTLDEKSVGKVFFDQSKVQMGLSVGGTTPANPGLISTQTDSAVIRYNVTAVDGLFVPRVCRPTSFLGSLDVRLRLRYLASGPGARVVVKLIEVNLATGTEKPHVTFDSAKFSLSDNYQVQSASVCGRPWTFDFENKAYYIEATLTTNSIVISAAGIEMIQFDNFTRPVGGASNECADLADEIVSERNSLKGVTDIRERREILRQIRQLVERSRRLGCPRA